MNTKTLKSGVYRHYKGQFYLVLGVARHSETQEDLVVYITLYHHKGAAMWVRPSSMFFQTVTIDGVAQPRFEYIGSEIPDSLHT